MRILNKLRFAPLLVALATMTVAPARGFAAQPTVSGALLPTTASPWYSILLAGLVLTLIGVVGFWTTARKIHE